MRAHSETQTVYFYISAAMYDGSRLPWDDMVLATLGSARIISNNIPVWFKLHLAVFACVTTATTFKRDDKVRYSLYRGTYMINVLHLNIHREVCLT